MTVRGRREFLNFPSLAPGGTRPRRATGFHVLVPLIRRRERTALVDPIIFSKFGSFSNSLKRFYHPSRICRILFDFLRPSDEASLIAERFMSPELSDRLIPDPELQISCSLGRHDRSGFDPAVGCQKSNDKERRKEKLSNSSLPRGYDPE